MLSVSTSGKSRFQGKLDKIFWFIIMILPLVFWLVLNMVPVSVSAETENTEDSATVSTVADNAQYSYRMYFTYNSRLKSEPDLPAGLSSGWSIVMSPSGLKSDVFDIYCSKDGSIYDSSNSDVLVLTLYTVEGGYYYDVDINNLLIIDIPSSFVETFSLDFSLSNYVYHNFSNNFFISGFNDTVRLYPLSGLSCLVERVLIDEERAVEHLSLNSVLVDYFGIDMISDNSGGIIGDTLYGVFGSTGIFPIFTRDSAMIYYMIYFVYVEILHVLIDILVFIPRFAHKILGKAINFGD